MSSPTREENPHNHGILKQTTTKQQQTTTNNNKQNSIPFSEVSPKTRSPIPTKRSLARGDSPLNKEGRATHFKLKVRLSEVSPRTRSPIPTKEFCLCGCICADRVIHSPTWSQGSAPATKTSLLDNVKKETERSNKPRKVTLLDSKLDS